MTTAQKSIPTKSHRKPISGPAMLVLAIVLAGIWFGGQSLNTTKTVTVSGGSPSDAAATTSPVTTSESTPDASAPAVQAPTESSKESPQTVEGAKLPDGYPKSIPTPTNGELTGGFGSSTGEQQSFVVTYSVPGSTDDVNKSYQQSLKAAGYTIDDLSALPGGESGGFFGASKDSVTLTVSLADDKEKTGSVVLSLNAVVN